MDGDDDSGRARKRRETHARITDAALTLFMEQGYEATTVDSIAAASGIARRTFFHYYVSKDEIILAWQTGLPAALRDAITRQGAAGTPYARLKSALFDLATDMRPDIAITIGRIVRSTPALQAGNFAKFLKMEEAACAALAEAGPVDAEALRPVAMVGVGAMRLAVDAWASERGERPLADHLRTAFAGVEAGLGIG